MADITPRRRLRCPACGVLLAAPENAWVEHAQKRCPKCSHVFILGRPDETLAPSADRSDHAQHAESRALHTGTSTGRATRTKSPHTSAYVGHAVILTFILLGTCAISLITLHRSRPHAGSSVPTFTADVVPSSIQPPNEEPSVLSSKPTPVQSHDSGIIADDLVLRTPGREVLSTTIPDPSNNTSDLQSTRNSADPHKKEGLTPDAKGLTTSSTRNRVPASRTLPDDVRTLCRMVSIDYTLGYELKTLKPEEVSQKIKQSRIHQSELNDMASRNSGLIQECIDEMKGPISTLDQIYQSLSPPDSITSIDDIGSALESAASSLQTQAMFQINLLRYVQRTFAISERLFQWIQSRSSTDVPVDGIHLSLDGGNVLLRNNSDRDLSGCLVIINFYDSSAKITEAAIYLDHWTPGSIYTVSCQLAHSHYAVAMSYWTASLNGCSTGVHAQYGAFSTLCGNGIAKIVTALESDGDPKRSLSDINMIVNATEWLFKLNPTPESACEIAELSIKAAAFCRHCGEFEQFSKHYLRCRTIYDTQHDLSPENVLCIAERFMREDMHCDLYDRCMLRVKSEIAGTYNENQLRRIAAVEEWADVAVRSTAKKKSLILQITGGNQKEYRGRYKPDKGPSVRVVATFNNRDGSGRIFGDFILNGKERVPFIGEILLFKKPGEKYYENVEIEAHYAGTDGRTRTFVFDVRGDMLVGTDLEGKITLSP
jgi:phage FluMu protein Com